MVDSLIRDGSITAQMATSLMNDSGYAHEAMQRLLSMAENLLLARGEEASNADLALTADELQDLVDERVVDEETRTASVATPGRSP